MYDREFKRLLGKNIRIKDFNLFYLISSQNKEIYKIKCNLIHKKFLFLLKIN